MQFYQQLTVCHGSCNTTCGLEFYDKRFEIFIETRKATM